jgi:hypothetical protein
VNEAVKPQPDPGVRAIVRVLNALEWVILYELFCLVPWCRSMKLAYFYVGGWICVLALILAAGDKWVDADRGWFLLIVGIAAYRMLDLLRWYGDFLLDRAHNHVVSTERNLVFVVANLVEAALIGAIWLYASRTAASPGEAFYDGFALVTQLGLPDLSDGGWAKLGVVMTEVTALTLLLGGVAVLIAEVQGKVISSKGEWRGESKTGARKQTDQVAPPD